MFFCRTALSAAALVVVTAWAHAQEIYVDSVEGSDSNDGASPDAPKQTLASIGRASRYEALLLKAGGTYETQGLNVNNAMVTFYGDGPAPILLATGGFAAVSVGENAIIDGIKVMGGTAEYRGTAFTVGGPNAEVMNCEVDGTGSAIAMGFGVRGEGNYIHHNNVHDLGWSISGDQMGTSGGAEAYIVNASNNEVAYNVASRCEAPNTTLGGAEGGCLEIIVQSARDTVRNVSFHHNYCELSVGLWEGCSGNFTGDDAIQLNHGIIEDVYVAYNVSIDSMWLYLLAPVNTDFRNVIFEHNTLVHTEANADTEQRAANNFTAAVTQETVGENSYGPYPLEPGNIIVRNNAFIVDGGAGMFQDGLPASDHYNNLFAGLQYPNSWQRHSTEVVVSLAEAGLTETYRLAEGSPAIDSGSAEATEFTSDFDGNAVPQGEGRDIGAFEYCTGSGCQPPVDPGRTAGGTGNQGGSGGSSPEVGGAPSVGGSAPEIGGSGALPGTGGGRPLTGGATTGTGGPATGGVSEPNTGGQAPSSGGSDVVTRPESGGAGTSAIGGAPTGSTGAVPGAGGSDAPTGGGAENTGGPGAAGPETTGSTETTEPAAEDDTGCGCVVAGSRSSGPGGMLGLLLALGAFGLSRRRH